jgi:hypothetical protein
VYSGFAGFSIFVTPPQDHDGLDWMAMVAAQAALTLDPSSGIGTLRSVSERSGYRFAGRKRVETMSENLASAKL